jgi:isoaspartyl peptidase/L-asparaginase-like protein (Ntn-hydrolase superfamily)
LIRVLFTRTAVDALRAGATPAAAAAAAVHTLSTRVGGRGGIILLDYATPGAAGIGLAFNTPRMAFAYQTSTDAAPIVGIDPSDLPSAAPPVSV